MTNRESILYDIRQTCTNEYGEPSAEYSEADLQLFTDEQLQVVKKLTRIARVEGYGSCEFYHADQGEGDDNWDLDE